MPELLLRPLENDDIQPIAAAFAAMGWNKPAAQYQAYLQEQQAGARDVVVAAWEGVFAGYVTICWQSSYPLFREANIPEIVDLNVLPQFRRRGIASALMDAAEERIACVSKVVGIGVGMTADYGAAQRMYARRGYIPDGRGLASSGRPLVYGDHVRVDDDLCLYFTRPAWPALG